MNEIKQIKKCEEVDSEMFSLKQVSEDDVTAWEAIINGPKDSLYDGYQFKVSIKLPDQYPFVPPEVKFITHIKHLNVSKKGDICMDILKNNWSSSSNMRTILASIVSLLDEPNPVDPFNPELAALYQEDHEQYIKEINNACKRYAFKK